MSTWTDQNSLFLSLPTDQFLAIITYGEAGNQGAEGMMGVLNVVRNRTLDQSFYDMEIYNLTGDAYKAVGLKKWQFSMFNAGDPVRTIAERMANNFAGEVGSNSALNQAYGLAQMLIQGTLADNTGGAQFYYAPAGVSQAPSWASSIAFLGKIGDQLFYGSGVSAALSSTVASVSGVVSSVGEALTGPNVTTLILAGLGIGIIVALGRGRKLKKLSL
jgi:hypothetical protein